MDIKKYNTITELLDSIFDDEAYIEAEKIDALKINIRQYFIGILLDRYYKKYMGYHMENEMIPVQCIINSNEDEFLNVVNNIDNSLKKTDDLLKEYMSKNEIIRELLFINNEYEIYEEQLRMYIDIINIVDKSF